MLAAILGALWRNSPGAILNLQPTRSARLAGANSGEDLKLQRARRKALFVAQPRHERRNVGIFHGGQVFDAVWLLLRQQTFQKPLPPCRVVPLAKVARRRPI